jgi:hypothetical protein
MSSSTDGQNIVDGLLTDKAVCAGISESLQYLLYQMDVPCYGIITIYGDISHRANIIKIDGEWYYFDITSYMKHIFDEEITVQPDRKLLLVDDSFLQTHTIDTSKNPPLPACTSDKYMTAPEPTEAPTPKPVPQVTILSSDTGGAQEAPAEPPILPVLVVVGIAAIIAVIIIVKKRAPR